MARVIWAEPALSDLEEIAEYIALDDFDAAQRLVQKVFSNADRLGQFPESGRTPPELENSIYQEIITGPCRIFYRSTSKKVTILHVMRSERMLRQYIIEERNINKEQ